MFVRGRCIVHSQRMDADVQNESTHSRLGKIFKSKKTSNDSRTIGFVTSRQIPINCCKQTSAVIGGIVAPEAHNNALEHEAREHTGNVTEKHTQSIQAILGSLPFTCPYCSRKYNKHKDSVHTIGDHIEDQMASSCRYYSDLLSKKIIRFKQNVKKRLTNELDTFSPSNIYVEACTMKPSGRQDENLQVKIKKREIINQNCILSPTISTVDIRRNESHDLKTLYYMLTAIEGRVRRLKQNL